MIRDTLELVLPGVLEREAAARGQVSVISGSILIQALYFRFINRDDIDNTDESNRPELAVSRRRPQTYR